MENIGSCKNIVSVKDNKKPRSKRTELLTPLMICFPLKFGGHIQNIPYDWPTLRSRWERERAIGVSFLEIKVQSRKEEKDRETKIEGNHVLKDR